MLPLTCLQRGAYRTNKILKPKNSSRVLRNFMRLESSFIPQHILILTKISKYEHLKIENPNLNEEQFKKKLNRCCINYDAVFNSHTQHQESKSKLFQLLKSLNIEFRIKNKYTVDRNSIEWADLIMPVGGDGTFLLTSNLIVDSNKPVIGINSNPEHSEGFLMLPVKYTKNMSQVFEKLKSGNFKYLMRSRIRTTVHGDNIWETPYHLHEKNFSHMSERFYSVHGQEKQKTRGTPPETRQLPWLALNEVFIGESLAARISSLQFNDGDNEKCDNDSAFRTVKCSGICVSTGTGSTSWFRTIKSLTPPVVESILAQGCCEQKYTTKDMEQICFNYNSSLTFSPDDVRLRYIIRDIINKCRWREPNNIKSENFCKKLIIRSQCYDGGLFIDGGIAVNFNAGTTAILEIAKEDALRSIILLD